MGDYIELNLTSENAASWDFEIPPIDRHAGPDDTFGIVADKINVRVGNKPLLYNLRKLFELTGQNLPADLQIFVSYDLWLVCHTIGVIKAGGFDSVSQLGYKVQIEMPNATVVDVLPKTEFYSPLTGKVSVDADLGINGQLSLPNPNLHFTNHIFSLGASGSMKLAADSQVAARISFKLVSSVVQSIGVGSDYSEWVLNRHESPLYGDDISFMQILLLPEGSTELKFKSQVYATIPAFNLIPSRRKSEWLSFTCALMN